MVSPMKPRVSCYFQNLPVLCSQANAEYTYREVFSLNKKYFSLSLGLLISFVLWTAAITAVDVRAMGPNGSLVGFAVYIRFLRYDDFSVPKKVSVQIIAHGFRFCKDELEKSPNFA